MANRTRIVFLLALCSAPLSTLIPGRGEAHPAHTPSVRSPSADPAHSLEPGSSTLDPPPVQLDEPEDTLGRCTWRAGSANTNTGGPIAVCAEDEIPISAGVFIQEYDDPVHDPLVVFSPSYKEQYGVEVDGAVDGEGLSDSHPQIHGEPPPDGTPVDLFHPSVSATALHYQGYIADTHDNDARALCCKALEPKPSVEGLVDCEYRTELVTAIPESDPDLAGQYVASLACSSGYVTSGGCFAQFFHETGEFGLTGSHPYAGIDTLEMPSGDHDSAHNETGWACRLDREPSLYTDPDDYEEKIAVTVLCCD